MEKENESVHVDISKIGGMLNMVEKVYKPDPVVMKNVASSRMKTCIYFKYKCLLIFILGMLGLAQLFYILICKIVENEKLLNILGEFMQARESESEKNMDYTYRDWDK